MLSVLIPVFNTDVCQLIQRIHQQLSAENSTFELLIADDASTDNTCKQNNASCAERLHCHIFNFEKNKGRTATRNFLAQQAKYEWLLFLDADVLPKTPDFIHNFIKVMPQSDLVFGGITYSETPPPPQETLRWRYGKSREARSVQQRQKTPYYSIISPAILVRKEVFIKANRILKNVYGLDSVFTQNLKEEKAKITHIDNPIIHLGLETNTSFLKKTIKGLETLVLLEKQHLITTDYRAVQSAYQNLQRLYLTQFYCALYRFFKTPIQHNLLGKNPSLFLFDLYKLYHYARLKSRG